jgi:hypothetical protein
MVRKILKGKNKVPTQCLQVTFAGKQLPEQVFVGYQHFPVQLFVDCPWQCYNCQDFGHNVAHCRGKTKYVICAGAHRSQACPNRYSGNTKGSNCQGRHTASYRKCSKMKEAKTEEKIRAEQELFYHDVVKVVKTSQRA